MNPQAKALVPSGREKAAAKEIEHFCWGWPRALVERVELMEQIIAKHTRVDGRPAEYWYMAFEQVADRNGEYIQFIGELLASLAECQRSLEAAEKVLVSLKQEKELHGQNPTLIGQVVHYFASRSPPEKEEKPSDT